MSVGRVGRTFLLASVLAGVSVAVLGWADRRVAAFPSPAPPGIAMPGAPFSDGAPLYHRHCAACHGPTGDAEGRLASGPLRPRSFRREPFRYVTTDNGIADERDVLRVVCMGIPSAGMPPSRFLLSDTECAALARYVREIRRLGVLEALAREAKEGGEAIEAGEAEQIAREAVMPGESVPVPPDAPVAPDPQRGAALFAQHCATCHGARGDGRGESPVLADPLGRPVPPRNLARDPFRGGERDEDLFRRVRCGIPGTAMSAFGPVVFSDDDVWCVIDHVRSLRREASCR
ncbi:MAG: c-type cytochrome [Planctomycetes bacterium]|nr:c-type cytochrome [Planctomycetota bacterium]